MSKQNFITRVKAQLEKKGLELNQVLTDHTDLVEIIAGEKHPGMREALKESRVKLGRRLERIHNEILGLSLIIKNS